MPSKLRTVLNVPTNPNETVVVDLKPEQATIAVRNRVQSTRVRLPVPAASNTAAQRSDRSSTRYATSAVVTQSKMDCPKKEVGAEKSGSATVTKDTVTWTSRTVHTTVPKGASVSTGPPAAVGRKKAKRKARRGGRRVQVVRNTNVRVGEKGEDPVQTRVTAEPEVILRSLSNSVPDKIRARSSSKQSKQECMHTTAGPMTRTGNGKENSRNNVESKDPENISCNQQDKTGRPMEQSSALKDAKVQRTGEPASKLSRASQSKENVQPCYVQSSSTAVKPALKQSTPSAVVTDKTDKNSKSQGNYENCSRCKASGCHKMDEYEKQRMAQMKRQRLVKATAAGGKRRYQQRKANG